jgi:hypothetical protein
MRDISDQISAIRRQDEKLSVISTERKGQRSDRVMVKGGAENAEVRREGVVKLRVGG